MGNEKKNMINLKEDELWIKYEKINKSINKNVINLPIMLIMAIIGLLSGAIFITDFFNVKVYGLSSLVINIVTFSGIGIVFYLIFYWALDKSLNRDKKRIEDEILKLDNDKLQSEIDNQFFSKLIQINFKYLDKYYNQTKEQADKSFMISLIVSITGFIIIAIGIALIFINQLQASVIITIAGVLSEFIAAVFFYLYNKTIIRTGEYHNKLVLSQNIALSLKTSDELAQPERNETKKMIIKELISEINRYLTIK